MQGIYVYIWLYICGVVEQLVSQQLGLLMLELTFSRLTGVH
jgi:hypothetical protein